MRRHRRVRPPGDYRPRQKPRLRHRGGRHERTALGRFDVHRSHELQGHLGNNPQSDRRDLSCACSGGRLGLTVWGHIKVSPGAWALALFRLAAPQKVENQAAMVALGRPGVGESLLGEHGFVDIERFDVPFVWEFADPEMYARALASTGPAYEAIQNVGEETFYAEATELASSQMRPGHVLRAAINVVGFIARKPSD